VRQWLGQCGQLARSSAAPRGSRDHAGAGPAARTQHTLGACSHSAEEQQHRGQAWAVPHRVRRSGKNSELSSQCRQKKERSVAHQHRLRNPRSLGTARVAHESACRRAPKRSHSAMEMATKRSGRVAAWPTGTDTMHDDATMCETRDVKGGAGHALLLAERIHEALVLGSIPHGGPVVFR